MRVKNYCFLIFIFLFSVPIFTQAHHSWPASYHVDREITLEGKVLRYLWRNPHVFIYLEVTNEQDAIEKWEVEIGNTNVMTRRGWSADTIQIGDEITVGGWPGRSEARRINMQWFMDPGNGFNLISPIR
jgi:hypothetical protein